MLFNSLPFLCGFLPLTLAAFFLLGRTSHRLAALFLAVASLFFYAWWNPSYLGLLLASVVFNYGAGALIARLARRGAMGHAKLCLAGAVAGDLALLGVFKYAGFFAGVVGGIVGTPFSLGAILLPLGISFFTFTQIAFLVDTYRGKAQEYDVVRYLLFVTYFPHLIAGPILHHAQIMPQFADRRTYRPDWGNLAVGVTIFAIGLVKKVLVADNLAVIANPIFGAAQRGGHPALAEAWAGAFAFALQLYFDFSGYSDMAIGLSRLFNVKLPLNFDSPYKATSIIDFWRRWHMTLSAFLLAYLYIPLGGNRHGTPRRYVNLFVTMLLGGLWHGAGWTFLAWGALHGVYLMINHGFRAACRRWQWVPGGLGVAGTLAAGALTFAAVTIGWVIFRAESFAAAWVMLQGMFGATGISHRKVFAESGLADDNLIPILLALLAVWLLPNTQQFMRLCDPAPNIVPAPRGPASWLVWRPEAWWSCLPIAAGFAAAVIAMSAGHVSEFLYYQF
jgi:D-alanyl-lipoteichoic acid acyltransferase DltB (MBOAT superfamily)